MVRKKLSSAYYSVQEFSELLGVSLRAAETIVKRKDVTISRVGKFRKIHKDDFKRYVEKVRVKK